MELALKETVWGIRGLVAVLLIVALFVVWSTNLFDVQDWFFNLLRGGAIFSPVEKAQAMQSVEALTCAINSVAIGRAYTNDGCGKYFASDTTVSQAPYTGSVFGGIGMGKTLCHRIEYYYYCSTICYSGDEEVEEFDSASECEKAKLDYQSRALMEEEGGASVTCTKNIKLSGSKGDVVETISRELLECFDLVDKIEVTCAVFETSDLVSGVRISEDDIEDWMKRHGGEKGKDLIGDIGWDDLNWGIGTVSKDSPDSIKVYTYPETFGFNEVHVEEGSDFTCWVNDFQLPQEVTDWEQYILYHGDPEYLVYWNMFPDEEDTWNIRPTWKTHALIAAISLIPFGRAAGIGTKVAVASITKRTTKSVAFKIIKRYGATPGVIPAYYLPKLTDKVAVKQLVKANLPMMVKKYGRRWLAKQVLKESVEETISKKFALKYIPSVAIKGVTMEAGLAAATIADSMIKKYTEPVRNGLGLAVPFESITQFPLVDGMEGKPVIIQWRPETLKEERTFYLASPCYLNSFEVRKEMFKCGTYSRGADGITSCLEPKIKSKGARCGVFDKKNIDGYIGEPVYEELQKLLKRNDKRLFEHCWDYNDNDTCESADCTWDSDGNYCYQTGGKLGLKKIFLPFASEDELMYLDNIRYLGEREETISGGGYTFTKVIKEYSATLHKGSSTFGLKSVNSEDEIVMEAGRDYVLHIYWVNDGLNDDIVVDIYDVVMCDDLIDRSDVVLKQLICDEVKGVTSEVQNIEGINNLVDSAFNDETAHKVKFTPSKDIKASELVRDIPWTVGLWFGKTEECGQSQRGELEGGRNQCFRILGSLDDIKITHTRHKGYDYPGSWEIDDPVIGCKLETSGEDFAAEEKEVSDEDGEKTEIAVSAEGVGSFFLQKDGKISLIDEDYDGDWDSIEVSDKMTLSDIDSDGNPTYISMTNCIQDGVLIDLLGLSDKKKDVEGSNYCVRAKSTASVVLVWVGRAVGVGLTIVAGIVTGGGAWVAGAVWAVAAAAVEASAEAYTEWEMTWP